MIDTKEQYEKARTANAILYQGSREKEIHSQDLIETIEALREVARKADEWFDPDRWALEEGPFCIWCNNAKKYGHREDCVYEAIPDWLLE